MGRSRLVTDEMVQRGADLVYGGMTVTEAAKALGLLQVTLRARFRIDMPHMRKVAVENRDRRTAYRRTQRAEEKAARRRVWAASWKRKVSREQLARAAQEIDGGRTQRAVAAELGVHSATLGRMLKRYPDVRGRSR